MIVVTAPTGAIGSQVVENLLGRGQPVRVIARDPDRLPGHVREQVQIVQGSHGDRDVVERAFAGAEAVFWLVPPDPRADSVYAAFIGFSIPAAEAIVRHGVRHVVNVSALGREVQRYAGYVSASLAVDDLLSSTATNFRALTMPSFMDNVARQAGTIKNQGVFHSPIRGDLRMPSVATRDIASTAADLLLDRSWTGRDSVPVLGPEDLSWNDMAAIMTEVLGRPVRFQQIPAQAYKDNLMRVGMSRAMAQGMLDMALAKDEGIDLVVPRTPASTTPTTFRQWCREALEPAVLR